MEGNCIEISLTTDCTSVRDSKAPTGHVLACNQTEWTAFLGAAETAAHAATICGSVLIS
ncbi:MAG: DUF397 domain-containing protein [Pseudonocardiales bacterium]|nr:DUF397 domain-containing protein [Pseudonocardiales bacterium]